MSSPSLPPRQRLAAPGKWPTVGEALPRRDDRPWQVEVIGEGISRCCFDLAKLRELPQCEQAVDIHCVTRWSKLGVRFAGVRLATLLQIVAPPPTARFVSFVARSSRDHSTSLALGDALALETLLALDVDGAPLEEARGGPVRVVVPGRYFYKSLKWLERIELLPEDRPGFWESTAGYHNTGDIWREQRYAAPEVSDDEARMLLAEGNVSGRELRSLAAADRDLAGLMARGALLRDADFRRCQLQSASFDEANLSNARFDGADLREARFRRADLEGADFRGADLRGADLRGASLFGCTFADHTNESPAGGARVDRQTRLDAAGLDGLAPEERDYLLAALERAMRDESELP